MSTETSTQISLKPQLSPNKTSNHNSVTFRTTVTHYILTSKWSLSILLYLFITLPSSSYAQNCVSEKCPDDICISGSTAVADLDGRYTWAYWDTYLNGSAYYNLINDYYIYPYILSNEYYYLIGDNISSSVVSGYCNIGPPPPNNYIFNLHDCIGEWNSYKTPPPGFAPDPTEIVTSCQDVCSTGHQLSFNLDGTYVFDHFDTSANGNVYYCASCGAFGAYGAYLHPYIGSSYYWLFSSNYSTISSWVHCIVGTNLPIDYVFDLRDCINKWKVYNYSVALWQSINVLAAKCNYPTTATPTVVTTNPTTAIPTAPTIYRKCCNAMCLTAHGDSGCINDINCETDVCAQDSFCCSTIWDSICVGLADDICVTPSPTYNPTTPSLIPTFTPSVSPSTAPTTAPTIAPTPSTPTTSPTFTDNHCYVRENGNDYGYCNALNATCNSIEYSWNCFLGIGGIPNAIGCKDIANFNANGEYNIGNGIWDFKYQINFDDNNVIIRGQGSNVTTFNYIGNENAWITCRWPKCWISLIDLTISSNRTEIHDTMFMFKNGGTLYVENVIFDGNNYLVNQNKPFWKFINDLVTVEFHHCYFTNNDVVYTFSNGASVLFNDCTFHNNYATSNNNAFSTYNGMFYIKNGADVIFKDCLFTHNQQIDRVLFSVQNNARLSISNCIFDGNIGNVHLFYISNNVLHDINITDSLFINNHGYQDIIYIENSRNVYIYSTVFDDNTNTKTLINIRQSNMSDNYNFSCVRELENNLDNINVIASTFKNNSVDYALNINRSQIYIDENTIFIDNTCNEYCIASIDSSLDINFAQSHLTTILFGHNNAIPDNIHISLCIRNIPSVTINDYLSFLNTNEENTKIMFDECSSPYILNSNTTFDNINTTVNHILNSQIYNIAGDKVGGDLTCLSNATLCEIHCTAIVSCFASTITTKTQYTHILCDDAYACQNSFIYAQNATSLHIICSKDSSCQEITVTAYNIDHFKLDCIHKDSCMSSTINISNAITSEINCYKSNACDNINIITNDPNTTISLYEYSANVIINTVGYGSINLQCAEQDAYILLDKSHNTIPLAVNTLFGAQSPCDSTHIICNQSAFCDIHSQFTSLPNNLDLPFVDIYQCYGPIYYQNIIDTECIGTCNGPTMEPTSAPSISPTQITISPTNAPTNAPVIAPTNAPTISPSNAPTNAPIIAPSSAPTLAPVINPTISPTNTPSITPSFAPSISPTNAPTISPSLTPTNIPSIAPTLSPTFSPVKNPTFSPTISPTPATNSPTMSPTDIPTTAPSIAPTPTPTRQPTIAKPYDSYFDIVYALKHLTNDNIIEIVHNIITVITDMVNIIEIVYDDDDNLVVDFADFWVKIEAINDVKIDEIENKMQKYTVQLSNSKELLRLTSKIECNAAICHHIVEKYNQQIFEETVTNQLKLYFAENNAINDELEFEVLDVSDTKELYPNAKKQVNYVFWFMLCVCGLLLLFSVFAFLYNVRKFPRLPGMYPVDDGAWATLMIYALQFWDLVSDINLSIEILARPDLFTNIFISISAITSTSFVLVPYITNIIIAVKIKEFIKHNEAAKAWFQFNTAAFTVLVVLSGGCYPSLALVSSKIFGLKITSCGLTRYELKQMGKIKILGTILLENIPQLFSQALYAYSINKITQTVALAFAASFISVIASTMSYLIDRDASDTKVAQYYLSTEKISQQPLQLISNPSGSTLSPTLVDDDDAMDGVIQTVPHLQIVSNTNANGTPMTPQRTLMPQLTPIMSMSSYSQFDINYITDIEKRKFIDHRGLAYHLGEQIAECFAIAPKNIEVGYSNITKSGIITHIVHYVYEDDLQAMEEELQCVSNNVIITPQLFTQQLCVSLQEQLSDIFTKHFNINKSQFKTTYSRKKYGTNLRRLTSAADHLNNDNKDDNKDENKDDKRSSILKKVRDSIRLSTTGVGIELMPITNDDNIKTSKIRKSDLCNIMEDMMMEDEESLNHSVNELNVKMTLQRFFNLKGVSDESEKMDMISRLIDDKDDEMKEEGNDNGTHMMFDYQDDIGVGVADNEYSTQL